MKEQIYTIPLMDAFNVGDECPFCFIERNLEQHAMDFVLGAGASYMEDDIRAETDKAGFCREHYKKMFEYGNRLGCGLILTTHFKKKNEELKQQIKMFSPAKASMFSHFKKAQSTADAPKTSVSGQKHSRKAVISVTIIKILIRATSIRSLNSIEKILNLSSFSKKVKDSVSRILLI